jgi:Tfp pilus assembly ATPase PilU
MFIDSAKNTLRLASDPDNLFIINMRSQATMEALNHRYMATPDEAYRDVAALWAEHAKVDLTVGQVEAILSLYPRERITMVLANTVSDTDVADQLMSVLAHFYLGCSWPTYGDNVDSDRFLSLLQHQVKQMEF